MMHFNPRLMSTAAMFLSLCLAFSGRATESLHSTAEAANLKKALMCMELMENRADLAPEVRVQRLRDECFAADYIQHSPHVADGRDAVLALFAKRFRNNPHTSASVKRSAAEGDLVWLHMHTQHSAQDRGRAVINIFRLRDGKLVEHWNVIQTIPASAKNDNTMF